MTNLARKSVEPGIEEILKDPIFQRLMKIDRVEELTLQTLLRETAQDIRRKSA